MTQKEVQLELLIGKRVYSLSNKVVGRLEDVRAELIEGECYVTEFVVGLYGVFERLSALTIGRAILSIFGSSMKSSYRVPWDKFDLSDPTHPRITCAVSQLSKV